MDLTRCHVLKDAVVKKLKALSSVVYMWNQYPKARTSQSCNAAAIAAVPYFI